MDQLSITPSPKRIEERQEGKAENGEEVAIDFLKQLAADGFELIGADRAEHHFAGSRKIMSDEFRRQLAHSEVGDIRLRPHGPAIIGQRDRGVQCVGPAAKVEQLRPCRFHIFGLGDNPALKDEHLIGANDEGAFRQIAHRFRLGAGENFSRVMRVERLLVANRLKHEALVEPRRLSDESEPRLLEHPRPRLAGGRQNKRRTPRLQKSRHAKFLMPPAPALRGRYRDG